MTCPIKIKEIVYLGLIDNGDKYLPKNWTIFKQFVDRLIAKRVPEDLRKEVTINYIPQKVEDRRWFDPEWATVLEISYLRPETKIEKEARMKGYQESLNAEQHKNEQFTEKFQRFEADKAAEAKAAE